jgi:hypothetical protein
METRRAGAVMMMGMGDLQETRLRYATFTVLLETVKKGKNEETRT